MIRRKARVGFDWVLLSVLIAIIFTGWLMLYASSYEGPGLWFDFNSTVGRQTIWIAVSALLFLAVFNIEWRIWNSFSYLIYAFSIITLIAVLFLGKEIKGASSWFVMFGFSIQPAEFAKMATALAISSFMGQPNFNFTERKNILFTVLLFLVPAFLVLLQPDAGSAIIFMSFIIPLYRAGLNPSIYVLAFSMAFILIGALLWSPFIIAIVIFLGAYFFMALNLKNQKPALSILALLALFCLSSFRFINYGLLISIVFMAGLYFYFMLFKAGKYREIIFVLILIVSSNLLSFGTQWAFNNLLKPHQQSRINVWLKPHLSDPKGELYNIIQSKTAIGSGGFSGKGFLNGSMTKLNYVPEQNTDFVFSILGEEQGFLGCVSLIVLFTILLLRITMIAERSNFPFIRYYAYSVAGLIFFHFFINISMTMGLMPVIGIPLPLVSKGGSSLMAFVMMIGILLKLDQARTRY